MIDLIFLGLSVVVVAVWRHKTRPADVSKGIDLEVL